MNNCPMNYYLMNYCPTNDCPMKNGSTKDRFIKYNIVKNLHWLVCCFVFCITGIAQANETLSVFNNEYSAKLYGFSITVNSRLTSLNDNNYELYFNADSFVGSITERSKVKWNAQEQTVIPNIYLYERDALNKSKEEELHFNWGQHTVTNVKKNKTLPFDNTIKIQDNISYQLQLRQDLIAGKNNLEYAIADGKKIKKYNFEIVGEETLNTPLGDVQTVKVKRSHTSGDTVTYAWFAKKFQYLLVRLQQEENGSAYTIYISKANLNGKAIEHF